MRSLHFSLHLPPCPTNKTSISSRSIFLPSLVQLRLLKIMGNGWSLNQANQAILLAVTEVDKMSLRLWLYFYLLGY